MGQTDSRFFFCQLLFACPVMCKAFWAEHPQFQGLGNTFSSSAAKENHDTTWDLMS